MRNGPVWILPVGTIRHGFLDTASRKNLIELARDGSAAQRLARRANALALLDAGCWMLFLDNACYDQGKLVQAWLDEPGRRIKLHFIPAYCPHLNQIERLCLRA